MEMEILWINTIQMIAVMLLAMVAMYHLMTTMMACLMR